MAGLDRYGSQPRLVSVLPHDRSLSFTFCLQEIGLWAIKRQFFEELFSCLVLRSLCIQTSLLKPQSLFLLIVSLESINLLSKHCSEFLIHAADVEGLCKGIDEELVESEFSFWICHRFGSSQQQQVLSSFPLSFSWSSNLFRIGRMVFYSYYLCWRC